MGQYRKNSSTESSNPLKVVWAIDPFETETRPSKELIAKLTRWLDESNLTLQPVYVLSIPESEEDFHFKEDVAFRVRLANEAVQQYLKDVEVKRSLPVKMIVDTEVSRKRAIQKVIEFAAQVDAKCIWVSSHGRAGPNRFFFGSFSENLLVQSTRPLFFLTHLAPANEKKSPIRRALFPTDFSESSHQAFKNFLRDTRGMNLEITLFHSAFFPAVITSGWGVETVLPKNFMAEQEKWARKEGEQWIQEARLSHPAIRLIVQEDAFGSHVSDAILKAADKEEVQFIAMASRSGTLSSIVIGSVAREVFRSNRYPVWVYGPQAITTTIEERERKEPPSMSL